MIEWQWIGKIFLSRHKWILRLWLCIMALAMLAICITPYGYFNVWLSKHYQPNLGYFFKYYTYFGEEWLLVLIVLLLIFLIKNKSFALRLSAALIINSLSTIVLKYLIFNQNRPKLILQEFNLIFTNGVAVNLHNSFPSGHTSAAFAMAFALAFWFAKPRLSAFVLLMAIGVGFSRIYLQQHFLEDIVGGALVGAVAACLAAGFSWKNKIGPRI